MPRAARQPPTTLADRLGYDLAMTGGKMPIGVIVADEDERARALRWLAGKRHARLLTVATVAEVEAKRRNRG